MEEHATSGRQSCKAPACDDAAAAASHGSPRHVGSNDARHDGGAMPGMMPGGMPGLNPMMGGQMMGGQMMGGQMMGGNMMSNNMMSNNVEEDSESEEVLDVQQQPTGTTLSLRN